MGERHPDFGHDRVFLRHHLPGTNGFNDNRKCRCVLFQFGLQFFMQDWSSEVPVLG